MLRKRFCAGGAVACNIGRLCSCSISNYYEGRWHTGQFRVLGHTPLAILCFLAYCYVSRVRTDRCVEASERQGRMDLLFFDCSDFCLEQFSLFVLYGAAMCR